jgi:3-hydroxyisobutyrate/3-hydroxypropionate dehydrogenase
MMGYPMALNVRRKLPKSSTLYIYDLSQSALDRFVKEVGPEGEVVIASSAKEVVDNAVRSLI